MAEQESVDDNYKFIIEHFGEDRIQGRYVWFHDLMQEYIKSEQIESKVYISADILNHVIIDYFVDIYRLKEFQGIEKTHDSKIYAYLSFWTLRHKPLQIREEDVKGLEFVNEKFISEILRSYLFNRPANISISNVKVADVDNFLATLLYYLKYRDYSAKSIEMIILAFDAGRGYQYSVDHEK